MKNLFRFFMLLAFSLSTAAFVGCSSSNEADEPLPPTPPTPAEPTAVIKSVTADQTSVTMVLATEECAEYAYQVLEKGEDAPTNETIFWAVAQEEGHSGKLSNGDNSVKLLNVLDPGTDYVLYVVIKTNESKFLGKILSKEFATLEVEAAGEGVSLVTQLKDGFVLNIAVSDDTATRLAAKESVIRWNTADVFAYYTRTIMRGTTDAQALDTNGDDKFIYEEGTLTINNDNSYHKDENGNPIYDVNDDGTQELRIKYNTLVPGQKNYFIAGEFSWGDSPYYSDRTGWFVPFFDMDNFGATGGYDRITADTGDDNFQKQFWSGFYAREIFEVEKPKALPNANLNVEVVEAAPKDATIRISSSDDVVMTAFWLLDHATYTTYKEWLQNDASNFQWFITSESGAWEGAKMAQSNKVEFSMSQFMYEEGINPGVVYHVLATVAAEDRVSQAFTDFTFTLPDFTTPAPDVVVTPLPDECTHEEVVFNIRAMNGTAAYGRYAIGYENEWQDEISKGATYSGIIRTDGYGFDFGAEDVMKMNSAEGFNIRLPSKPNAMNRIAVMLFTEEGQPNDVDAAGSTAVADVMSKPLPAEDRVDSELFTSLLGDWTATANVVVSEYNEEENESYWRYVEEPVKSKVTFAEGIYCPDSFASVESELKKIYSPKDHANLETWYNQFAELAEHYNQQLYNRNYILGLGFDFYQHSIYNGAMQVAQPWNLFTHPAYASTIQSMFYDFGPKWFLHVEADGSLTMPVNAMEFDPLSSWYDSYSYHIVGWDWEKGVYYPYDVDNSGNLNFPVEVVDNDTLIIKPLVRGEYTIYPTVVVLVDAGHYADTIVASEIKLTRGWSDTTTTTGKLGAGNMMTSSGPKLTPKAAGYGFRANFDAEVEVYERVNFEPVTESSAKKHAYEFSPYVRR